ncbi:MAG TPA: tetratricopeptide repeat-containing protein kinase family protein, partial [Vicinamibacterales bacterium]
VYALGILLFELLSGVHPDAHRDRSATRLASHIQGRESLRLADALNHVSASDRDAIATTRGTTPDRLQRLLGGDLDTIVGKALKTDPAERYPSVAAFADDLRRYLADQPISARPDTVGYRTAKFVRRNRRLLAGGLAAALLVGGSIGYHAVRLAQERDRAELEAAKASRISELLTSLLTGADPYRTPDGREPTVRNLLDVGAERVVKELADRPDVQAELFTVIGRTYERMGLRDQALPLLEQALAIGRRMPVDDARLAQTLNDLGVSHREAGNLARAQALLTESLALRRRLHRQPHNEVAITLVELARVHMDLGDLATAEPLAREALDVRRAALGDEHRETATSKNELGLILMRRGDFDSAEPLMRENVATTERQLGPEHPNLAASKANLGTLLLEKGDPAAAERLMRESLEIDRRVFGETHAEYAVSLHTLSSALEAQSRLDEAEAMLQDAMRIGRSTLGGTHPSVLAFQAALARVRIARGQAASTETDLRWILDTRRRLYPTDRWRIAQAESLLGASLMAQRRYAEAEPLMLAAARELQPIPGAQGRERAANEARLVELRRVTGR